MERTKAVRNILQETFYEYSLDFCVVIRIINGTVSEKCIFCYCRNYRIPVEFSSVVPQLTLLLPLHLRFVLVWNFHKWVCYRVLYAYVVLVKYMIGMEWLQIHFAFSSAKATPCLLGLMQVCSANSKPVTWSWWEWAVVIEMKVLIALAWAPLNFIHTIRYCV